MSSGGRMFLETPKFRKSSEWRFRGGKLHSGQDQAWTRSEDKIIRKCLHRPAEEAVGLLCVRLSKRSTGEIRLRYQTLLAQREVAKSFIEKRKKLLQKEAKE